MLQNDANGPTLGESLANAHSVGKLKKETNYSKNNLFICFIVSKNVLGTYYMQEVGDAWKKIHPRYELELKGS